MAKVINILSTSGLGFVDLGYIASPIDGLITNTGGEDATIPLANSINAGLLSPGDFDIIGTVTGLIVQTITDGDTTHAPSGDVLFDALFLKANDNQVIHNTGNETKTGNLTVNAIIKAGGTSLQFLKADGSVDNTVYAPLSSLHPAVTIGTANGLSIVPATQVLSMALSSTSTTGTLTSTDWNTFNDKQDALTNPVTGTGFAEEVSFWTNTTEQSGDPEFMWDIINKALGIGGMPQPGFRLDVDGQSILRDNLLVSGDIIEFGLAAYQLSASGSFIQSNLSIGTATADLIHKLHVEGSTKTNGLIYTMGLPINGQDLDDLTDAGAYNGDNLINAPDSDFYHILVERYFSDDNYVNQVAKNFVTGRAYTRNKHFSWEPWSEIITTANDGVIGTGTLNYLPKWTSPSTIGNSQVFDNGTNVLIGTVLNPNPGARLNVGGAIQTEDSIVMRGAGVSLLGLDDLGAQTGYLDFNKFIGTRLSSLNTNPLTFGVNSVELARFIGTSFLIGTTTDNGNRLRVVGGSTELDQLKYTRAIDISGQDLDSITDAGFYTGNSLSNAPNGNGGFFYITIERYVNSTDYAHQTATLYGQANVGNKIYSRVKDAGTWQPWSEIYTTGTLINPVTGTGVAGQVAFWNGTNSLTGDTGFIWDSVNDRLGIGTNSPTEKLEISGYSLATGYKIPGGLATQYLMANGTTSVLADIVSGLITQTITDGDLTHAPSGDAVFDALVLKTDLTLFNSHVTNFSNPHNTTATLVPATPHADYLTAATVQGQLDNTETTVVGLFKNDKTSFKDIYQTGRVRIDTDVSVVSISPANTLNITACNDLLFVNEIAIDTPANKINNFLLSFGDKSFIVDNTNTPLVANTRGVFYIGLDKLGTPVYRPSKIYDQDVCYLARIIVENLAGTFSIISFKYMPDLANNRLNNRDRFVLSAGYIVPSGAASISFGNRAMSFYKNSINYATNKLDPNYLTIVDSVNPTPMQFLFALPNLVSLATSIGLSTVMNPTQWYNAAGAVGGGAVAPTNYQVYKLLITVTGTILIQTKASTSNAPAFGVNAIFANRDDALAGLTSVVFPEILPAGDSIGLGTFYLRAGTAVNGSQLNDPNDFYFRPFTSSSSSSTVGVTEHDLLSGKNDNPTYQHVTTVDIANWNAKPNDADVVHKTGSLNETIDGVKVFTGSHTEWRLNDDGVTNGRGFMQSNASAVLLGSLNDRNIEIYRNSVFVASFTPTGFSVVGDINSASYIKNGAPTTNLLLTGGGDIPQSTFQTALTNPVTGTGTSNRITKWTSPTTLGDSQIFDDSAKIQLGIGGSAPAKVNTYDSGTVGSTIGDYRTIFSIGGGVGNAMYVNDYFTRESANVGWTGIGVLTGIQVDASFNTPGSARTFWFREPANGTQSFGDSGIRTMTIDSPNSRVGIVTTNPASTLHVQGNGIFTDTLTISSGNQPNSRLILNNTSSAGNRSFCLIAGIDSVGQDGFSIFDTVGGHRFVIDNDGDVGIGTTNPIAKLHVAGDALVDGLRYTKGIIINDVDLDTLVIAGFYTGQSLTNAPNADEGTFYVTVETNYFASDWVHQTATSFGNSLPGNRIFSRVKILDVWQPWAEIYTTASTIVAPNYLPLAGGTMNTDARIAFAPNSTWSAQLLLGGDGVNGITRTSTLASIVTTSGNIHLDPGTDKATFINYYSGTDGIKFGGGANNIVASMDNTGQFFRFGDQYWNAGNDGADSGLDADLLDGFHATAFVLARNQSNWNDGTVINNVVGLLSWKNYGNTHVIFDASAGTDPNGNPINNSNSNDVWAPTYPTLMGWNGVSTYGVRVDSARLADTATSATSAGDADTVDGFHASSFIQTTMNTGIYYPYSSMYNVPAGMANNTWVKVFSKSGGGPERIYLKLYTNYDNSTNHDEYQITISGWGQPHSIVSSTSSYNGARVLEVRTNEGGGNIAEIWIRLIGGTNAGFVIVNCNDSSIPTLIGTTTEPTWSANSTNIISDSYDRLVNSLIISKGIKTYALTATAPNGAAPIITSSTTKVDNLNADLLDGLHADSFYLASNPNGYTSNQGNLIGLGSAGYIPRWVDTYEIEDSIMFDTGGGIGIGTNVINSAYMLQVAGAGTFAGNLNITAGGKIGNNVQDSFPLNGVDTAHYGMSSNAQVTHLSGFFGVSLITGGAKRLSILQDGSSVFTGLVTLGGGAYMYSDTYINFDGGDNGTFQIFSTGSSPFDQDALVIATGMAPLVTFTESGYAHFNASIEMLKTSYIHPPVNAGGLSITIPAATNAPDAIAISLGGTSSVGRMSGLYAGMTGNHNATIFSDILSGATDSSVIYSSKGVGASGNYIIYHWDNNSSTSTFSIDDNGITRAASFIKNGGTSSQYLMADGSVSTGGGGGGGVSGSGTANYLPKWTSGSALGNSLISDNGFNNGMGVPNPIYRLDIASGDTDGVRYTGTSGVQTLMSSAASYSQFGSITDHPLAFIVGSGEKMRILSNGSIGVGTSSPFRTFHIAAAQASLRVGPYYGPGEDRDYVDIFADGTASKIETSNEQFIINNLAGPLILNTAAGNVGVGNLAPSEKLHVTGNILASGTITASGGFFNSDLRLKDITKRDDDVAYFKWKDGRDDKEHIGYIAQEKQITNPDQVQVGTDEMLSLNYIEILVEKIRSLEKRIEELENR